MVLCGSDRCGSCIGLGSLCVRRGVLCVDDRGKVLLGRSCVCVCVCGGMCVLDGSIMCQAGPQCVK